MDPTSNGRQIEVDDPEDYTTRQRLKQIYEARRELRDMRREASSVRNTGGKSASIRAVQYYRSGVESYLLEVDTLLRQFEPGPELWHDKHYGDILIQPPGEWVQKRAHYESENLTRGSNIPLTVESIPDPKEVPVIGLKWLFEADSPVVREFEFETHSHTVNERITRAGNAFISWQQLNMMVTDVNAFLGELGIGLNIDDTDEWKI